MINEPLQGRYEIQEQLGRNPGRKTLLAKDLNTEELVVLKLLNFNSDFNWQDLKLFEREAQILKELSHPAIPNYLDFFQVDLPNLKSFALVQTYIPAQSLESQLQGGRILSEQDVKQIAQELLEVLNFLHSRQPVVIHRDIKPSNILLGNRSGNHVGQIYLIDFGSVKTSFAQQTGTMTVVGTYGYMPPEQFSGRATPASDLYALGATLIYLATGKHPADLLEDDIEIKFAELVNLSPEFTDWLKWLTKPTSKHRPQSASIALEKLLNPAPQQSRSLVSIPKPVGTKITLVKSTDKLEILIPPAGFSFQVGFMCLFCIVWFSFLLPFVLHTSFFAIFTLLHWAAGLGMLLSILFSLFGHTHLRLNNRTISLTYELFGIKYNPSGIRPKQDICKLEMVAKSVQRGNKGSVVEIPAHIIIWAGVRHYKLGISKLNKWFQNNQNALTSPELDWLVLELSNWLGLPISKS